MSDDIRDQLLKTGLVSSEEELKERLDSSKKVDHDVKYFNLRRKRRGFIARFPKNRYGEPVVYAMWTYDSKFENLHDCCSLCGDQFDTERLITVNINDILSTFHKRMKINNLTKGLLNKFLSSKFVKNFNFDFSGLTYEKVINSCVSFNMVIEDLPDDYKETKVCYACMKHHITEKVLLIKTKYRGNSKKPSNKEGDKPS